MSVDDSFLPPNWESIGPQLDRLLEADPAQRAQLLAEITGEDTERGHALEQLLAECERDMPLLDGPASERLADLARDDDSLGYEPPTMLGGRYRIGHELGQGGMARVFSAEDMRHGRPVAVKVIRPELSASLGRGRFLREIGMVARLRHPNIMPLFDSGDDDGVLYYVMPLEVGASLKARLSSGTPLPVAEGLSILRDVARAIAHAHSEGVVHRDIKPANVMLSGGAAVVADFGIGKAITVARDAGVDPHETSEGAIIGTPAYMAPEQSAGDPGANHRADLYSFGCLAYEVLTGAPPFHGRATEVIAGHLGAPPPPLASLRPDLPPPVVRVVEQCLRKAPAERPSSAREVLDVLEEPMVAPARRLRLATVRWAALLGVAALGAFVVQSVWPSAGLDTTLPVVMLPIRNQTGDVEHDYLARGLAVEVGRSLSREGVKLSSRARSAWDDPRNDLRAIERMHGHATTLSGSLRASGDTFEVQLVVSDTRARWKRTIATARFVQREIQDAQLDLAAAAAAQLGMPLLKANPPTVRLHPESYRLMLVGYYWLDEDEGGSPGGRATRAFDEAIRLDLRNAGAFAGLGAAERKQRFLGFLHGDAGRGDFGFDIDSTPPLILAMRGHLEVVARKQLGRGLSRLRRAAELAPSEAEVHYLLASALIEGGQVQEARFAIQTARRLEPLTHAYGELEARIEACADNPKRVLEIREEEIAARPDDPHVALGRAEPLAMMGRFAEAVSEWRSVKGAWSDQEYDPQEVPLGPEGYWQLEYTLKSRPLETALVPARHRPILSALTARDTGQLSALLMVLARDRLCRPATVYSWLVNQ